jgi:hypothetical protein
VNLALAHTHTPPTPPSGTQVPAGAGRVRVCERGTTVVLTLADTRTGPPFEIRLRRLLKVALRTFGLRCIDLKQQTQPPAPSAGKGT